MACDTKTVDNWLNYSSKNANVLNEAYFNHPSDKNIEQNMLKAVTQFVAKGASVLDVGCGTGAISVQMYDLGFKVDGMDISPAMLDVFNKNKGMRNISVRIGNIFELPVEELYDAVTCRYVFGHYRDFAALLKHIAKHVKKDGYIIFDSLTSESLQFLSRYSCNILIDEVLACGALKRFNDLELRQACLELGLKVECRMPGHFFYNNPLFALLLSLSPKEFRAGLTERWANKPDVAEFCTWIESLLSPSTPLELYGSIINVIKKVIPSR